MVDALADFPNVNSSVGDDALIVHHDLNIGIAVDLDFEGLLVPVIHQADGKRLRALAREISGLAAKARAKRLTMDDISGGTFTITNAGPFGTFITVPVINQPQVAILSTDGVRKRPVADRAARRFGRHRRAPGRQPGAVVGPPGLRRGLRGRLRGRHQEDHRDPGLVRGAVTDVLRARWLGRVRYQDGLALQRGLWSSGRDDWLLLLEHPHVYTLGVRAKDEHVLVDPASVGRRAGAQRPRRRRHLPRPGPAGGLSDPVGAHGPPTPRPATCTASSSWSSTCSPTWACPAPAAWRAIPGVWVGPARARAPQDLRHRGAGLAGPLHARLRPQRGARHGLLRPHRPVRDRRQAGHVTGRRGRRRTRCRRWSIAVVARAASVWGYAGSTARTWPGGWRRRTRRPSPGAGRASRSGRAAGSQPAVAAAGPQPVPVRMLDKRLAEAGVDPYRGWRLDERKPEWLRVKARMGEEYRSLRRTMRQLDLVTVCEEAGCPNIYECWADGTATFMINGDRCTRACGFCLVDTRKPLPPDPDEPERVAEAVARLGLAHAVVTTVARDDLADGGAGGFAATVAPSGERAPGTAVELLISDCKGDPDALAIDLRGRARRAQPQRRDGSPPAAGRPAVGLLRPQPGRPGPGQGGRPDHQVRSDRRDGGDASTRSSPRWPTCTASVSTSSPSASICARRRITSRWSAGGSPRSSSSWPRWARPWASPTWRRPRSPGPATTPARPRPRWADGRRVPEPAASHAGRRVVFVSGDQARVARLDRVRDRMVDLDVDVLLLSLGADLPWLTGYEAMPLERLTMLVVPADAGATLVVPRLEAPRVVEHPEVFALRPWSEHEDPVDIVAGLVGSRRQARGLRPDLGDLRAGPATAACRARRGGPASAVTGPLRAVKDAAEIEALAAASAAADRVAGAAARPATFR